MANYNNGGQFNTVNANTKLLTENGVDSKLEIDGWNNRVSMRISPAIGVNADGVTSYVDYKSALSVSLDLERALALGKAIEKKILPAIEANEPAAVGVSTGVGDTLRTINIAYDGSSVQLIVIAGSGRFTHTFEKVNIVIEPDTAATEMEVESKFMEFTHILSNSTRFIPMEYHKEKYIKMLAASFGNQRAMNQGYNNNQGNQNYGNQGGFDVSAGTSDHEEYLPFN